MRKHDVRKWLHACLDLLPVFLIPVFMIYSHRHDMTERTSVDITYKYQSNEVNTLDDLVEGNIYYLDELYINSNGVQIGDDLVYDIIKCESINSLANSAEYDEFFLSSYDSTILNTLTISGLDNMSLNDPFCYMICTNENCYISLVLGDDEFYFTNAVFIYHDELYNHLVANNELPQYTDYNEVVNVVVNDTDSDIMSVFMDDFNHAIDKYFNMGNVFNLGDIYQWFNTNIFGGNAPTIIYSIWNIALYEFVMDLLFLLYGLFMWFIDMIEHVMNKPFKSVK